MKSDMSKFVHSSIKILAVVTSQPSGWVEFKTKHEVLGKSFRADQFKAYPNGTELECTFRVNKDRRQLLMCKPTTASSDRETEDFVEEPEPQIPVETFPSHINDHFVPEQARPLLASICSMMEAGERVNMLVRGPSGYGKTSLYEALGTYLGYRVVMVNCAAIMDTEQWFGYQEARGGETVFLPTEFSEAIMEGKCIVVLDEANRIEPWLANSLFPMLDHRRSTSIHGVKIDAGKSIVFGHTVNEGVKFAGTHVMDAAYINRIDAVIEVAQMPQTEEIDLIHKRHPRLVKSQVVEIVGIAKEIRSVIDRQQLDIDASTRTTLKVAKLCEFGMTTKQAYEYVVVNATSIEDRKAVVDILQRDEFQFESKPSQFTESKPIEAVAKRKSLIDETVVVPGSVSSWKPFHSDQIEEIKKMLDAGKKIAAIKLYREITWCGLKFAKETIENLQERIKDDPGYFPC